MNRVIRGGICLLIVGLVLAWIAGDRLLFTARADDEKPGSSPQQPLDVSMIQLIARPDDYHGKYVRLFGFYRNEFEGTSIYLHREDYEQSLHKNGFWVTRSAPECDLKYILLEGRFNAEGHGHMGLWSGEIVAVKRMTLWPPEAVRRAR